MNKLINKGYIMNEAPEIIEEIDDDEAYVKEIILAEDLSDLDWDYLNHLVTNDEDDGYDGTAGWVRLYMEGGL